MTCAPAGASAGSVERGNSDVEIGMRREGAIFRRIEGVLEIVDGRSNLNAARKRARVSAGESRQIAERKIDLCDASRAPVTANPLEKRRRELNGIDHAEERAPWIGVGHDGLRTKLFACRKRDSDGTAASDVEARHVGACANLGACRAGRRGHGRRQGAQASPHEFRPAARSQVHEQHRRAAGRSRSARSAEDAGARDSCTKRLRLEPFRGEIGRRHRCPPQQSIGIPRAEAAEPPAELEQSPQITSRRLLDVRRRRLLHGRCELGDPFHDGQKLRIAAQRRASKTARCWRRTRRRRDSGRGCVHRRPARTSAAPDRSAPSHGSRGPSPRPRPERDVRHAKASRCETPDGISLVMAAPPIRLLRSRTSVLRPARAIPLAATRPLWPAPMTMTSWLISSRDGGFRARRCGPARP